jgi:hypothetical protein
MRITKIQALFLPVALVGILAACGGEPGQAEYDEAQKLEQEGHRNEAVAAYTAVVQAHPGTEAAKKAQEALDRIKCDDAKTKVTDAWKALANVSGEGAPVVDATARDKAKADFDAAKANLGTCTPESTDPACTEKNTAMTTSTDALVLVFADTCAGEAHTAALEAAKGAAGTVAGGGEAPADLTATVKDAAKAKADACVAGLTDAPASPNLTGDAIAQRVTDELLAKAEFKAVIDGKAEVDAACEAGNAPAAAPTEGEKPAEAPAQAEGAAPAEGEAPAAQ